MANRKLLANTCESVLPPLWFTKEVNQARIACGDLSDAIPLAKIDKNSPELRSRVKRGPLGRRWMVLQKAEAQRSHARPAEDNSRSDEEIKV